jgi:hypothetical protein
MTLYGIAGHQFCFNGYACEVASFSTEGKEQAQFTRGEHIA